MKYEGQPQVRKALVGLIRSNRHPIFAIRDFLVTPEMLSDCFDVATDGDHIARGRWFNRPAQNNCRAVPKGTALQLVRVTGFEPAAS